MFDIGHDYLRRVDVKVLPSPSRLPSLLRSSGQGKAGDAAHCLHDRLTDQTGNQGKVGTGYLRYPQFPCHEPYTPGPRPPLLAGQGIPGHDNMLPPTGLSCRGGSRLTRDWRLLINCVCIYNTTLSALAMYRTPKLVICLSLSLSLSLPC